MTLENELLGSIKKVPAPTESQYTHIPKPNTHTNKPEKSVILIYQKMKACSWFSDRSPIFMKHYSLV